MSSSQDLTLGQLLDRSISAAFEVTAAPSANDPTVQVSSQTATTIAASADGFRLQSKITSCISDLTVCSSLIGHLGVLSPNETLDDINTRDLRCILVDALRAEIILLLKTTSGKERIVNLEKAKVSSVRQLRQPFPTAPGVHALGWTQPVCEADSALLFLDFPQGYFRSYIELVDRYEIIPEGQRHIFAGPQHTTQDPAKRRESKIAQFKMERQIKSTLDVSVVGWFRVAVQS